MAKLLHVVSYLLTETGELDLQEGDPWHVLALDNRDDEIHHHANDDEFNVAAP